MKIDITSSPSHFLLTVFFRNIHLVFHFHPYIWCLLSPPLLLDFHLLFISRQLRDFLPSCIRFCFPKALARKIMINKVKEKEITVEDIKSNTMSKEVGRGNLHRWMVGLPNLTLDVLLFIFIFPQTTLLWHRLFITVQNCKSYA